MKRILIIIAASNILMSTQINAQIGNTGLSFLKIGVSGRALGMGDAYSAVADDPTAMFYNPAGLSESRNFKLSLMHKEWIQEMKTDYIAASAGWNKFSFGVSVNSTSINNIELRSKAGPAIGNFDAKNTAIGVSGAYSIDSTMSVGLTGKFLYEKIYIDDASGYALDFGGTYNTPFGVRLALAINNIGSMNELDIEATKLPTNIRLGGAYSFNVETPEQTLTIGSDLVTYTGEKKMHLHAGAEFDVKKIFQVRFGYQTGYTAKSISAGVGIHYSLFQLDYAYVPFKYELGTTHTISLGIEFN